MEPEDSRNEYFMRLYEPHHASALAYSRRLTGNDEDARDLLHDSLEAALRAFRTLRRADSFKPWFFRIIHNRHLNHIRRSKVAGKFEFHVDESPVDCLDEVVTERAKLVDALNKLKPEEREALILFEVEGMTLRDIAHIQGRSLPAIKYRLRVGRRKFREAYLSDSPEAATRTILQDNRSG